MVKLPRANLCPDGPSLAINRESRWDSSPAVIDAGMYNLPVGSGSDELVAVKYPAEGGGYTPGDTWELYVSKDGRVEYFVYHRGGAEPSLRNVGRPKKGRSSSPLNRSPRLRRWYADTRVLFGCGGQGDGIG
jgi:hypothetical protein